MSSNNIAKLCAMGGGVGAVALATSMIIASCSQPRMWCTSAHGDFAVKLELKSGDADSECGGFVGDVVGLDTYSAKGDDGNPDFSNSSVGIASTMLGGYYYVAIDRGAIELGEDGQEPVAFGPFTSSKPADADDFCEVTDVNPAEISLPELDPDPTDTDTTDQDFPGQPAVDMTLEWDGMRILVTPDAQGTQFEATLKVALNDCEAEYKALGLYPAVGCESNDDCGDKSGINPDFAVECDEDFGYCVLSKDPPSYE